MRTPIMTAFAVALCGGLALTSCTAPRGSAVHADEREEVVLTFATAFDSSHANNAGFWMFKERLEQNAPWIEIDYRGGPEVMAPNLLIEGVSSGAFDGASLPGDYYVDQLPAMEIPRFAPFTPTEERENGIAEIYDEIHREQLGVHYLGHTVSGIPQVVLLKEPVDSAELEGRAVRTSSATSGVVQAMGGIPVDLPGGEVYTALERGVVDGAAWASVGPSSLGLHDVVSYDLSPRFYESLANLVIHDDTWDSLDAQTQQAITDTMAEVEPEIFEHFVAASRQETAGWRDSGVERVDLPEAEAEKLLEIVYRDVWTDLDWDRVLRTSPAAAELREAFETGLSGDLEEAVPGGAQIQETSSRDGGSR